MFIFKDFQYSFSVISKKTGSSCAILVDSMFTPISFVGKYSLIFGIIFSLGCLPERVKKTDVVFLFLGLRAMVKSNYRSNSQAHHKDGGIIFV